MTREEEMNKQRKVLITITYNEMGIIIDTKAEEVAQPNLQPTCNQLATDLISRQDALKPFCTALDGTRIPEVDCDNYHVEFSVEFIKKHLLSLPSAEAEWIPCSERLPSEDGCYLVSTTGTNNDIIDIAYYTEEIWHKASRIKAWMPLPKPYREESEVEE